jgi:hypothetical protein
LLLKSGVGIAEKLGMKVDEPTGRLLRGIGDLLSGPQPAPATPPDPGAAPGATPPPRTNPPAQP